MSSTELTTYCTVLLMSEISVGLGPDEAQGYYESTQAHALGGWGATQHETTQPNFSYHDGGVLVEGVMVALMPPMSSPSDRGITGLFDKYGDPIINSSLHEPERLISIEGLST